LVLHTGIDVTFLEMKWSLVNAGIFVGANIRNQFWSLRFVR